MNAFHHCRRGAGNSPRRARRRTALLAIAFLAVAVPVEASPYVPGSDAEVLERLPEAQDAASRMLRQLHRQLVEMPTDMTLAIQVATLELERGRRLADPRYLGRAEAALLPWSASDAVPPRILLLHAILRQSTHDFATARADLARVLAAQPRNAQAWLTRATISAVQADYAAALADCGQLALLDIGLAPAVCTASVMSLTGHARLSLKALAIAFAAATAEPTPVRLWAKTVTGEVAARLGETALAETAFRDALGLGSDDAYLLGAYADFLLDQGRPAEVVELLKDRTRIDPLLLRLALAEDALGLPATAAHVADLQARFAVARLRGETIHQREEARFTLVLLHRPDEAVRLAQANWQVQREPADARILLEAAAAAGRPQEAAAAADWVRRNGVEGSALAKLAAAVPATVQP